MTEPQPSLPNVTTDPTLPEAQVAVRNSPLAIIAGILAVIGLICALIPAISWVGWIILGVALIVSLVALLGQKSNRGPGAGALAITLVAAGIAGMFHVATAPSLIDDPIQAPSDTEVEPAPETEAEAPGDPTVSASPVGEPSDLASASEAPR